MPYRLPAPGDNHLLAALPPPERERWQPCLEAVVLAAGQVVHEARQPPRYAYFPTGAVLSLQVLSADGCCDEVAVVGREGMTGTAAFAGSGGAGLRCVVQGAGRALRLSAQRIRSEVQASAAAWRLLLQYAEAQAQQVAQAVACSRHHSIEQRLALRLLVAADRQQDERPLVMTHEQLSVWLGVRRESVTEEAVKLQKAGLIAYVRGRIRILDAAGLEQRSCDCLAVLTNRSGFRSTVPAPLHRLQDALPPVRAASPVPLALDTAQS